jgi:hypothetical protein
LKMSKGLIVPFVLSSSQLEALRSEENPSFSGLGIHIP